VADQVFEYYPKDIMKFYTIKFAKKKVHHIMNMVGYPELLIKKGILKNTLLSNDFYPIHHKAKFSLSENLYRRSLLIEDFRYFKENILFSVKNKKVYKSDYMQFLKFQYNKPDILKTLRHKEEFSYYKKRTRDLNPFKFPENR